LLESVYLPIEDHGQREEESGQSASRLRIWKGNNNHLRKGACEDEDLNTEQKDETLATRGLNSVSC
jgi:hypothetical protein